MPEPVQVQVPQTYQCSHHVEFVSAVTDLVSTVNVLSNSVEWMQRMGRWIAGLCIAVVCLVIVSIFYAGALYKQVEVNTQMIQHFHGVSLKE